MFLKSERVSNLSSVVPSVQHFFSGVVVHHGVVAILVCELYVGVPLFSCLCVVSKVNGSGPAAMAVDTVDHSTDNKSIAYRAHWFCRKTIKRKALDKSDAVIISVLREAAARRSLLHKLHYFIRILQLIFTFKIDHNF